MGFNDKKCVGAINARFGTDAGFLAVTFIFSFCYVMLFGLLLQLVIIPLSPLHDRAGLLLGWDAVNFHVQAVEYAQIIRHEGWEVWALNANGQAPVGLTAVLYVLFGIERPLIFLPFNALLFSISTFVFIRLGLFLGLSRRFAMVASLPFFIMPSAAMLWAQIGKDIFAFCGIILILNFWMRFVKIARGEPFSTSRASIGAEFFLLYLGFFMVILMRPHLYEILWLITASGAFFAWALLVKNVSFAPGAIWEWRRPTLQLLIYMGFGFFVQFSANQIYYNYLSNEYYWGDALTGYSTLSEQGLDLGQATQIEADANPFVWIASDILPEIIDSKLEDIAQVRYDFLINHASAGSNIDREILFQSSEDVILYFPRALQIGIFSPFPRDWFARAASPGGQVMRAIVAGEMLLYYFAILGLVLAMFNSHLRVYVIVLCILSFGFILIHALAIPNMGTLYRMRYPWSVLLISFGLLGWIGYWNKESLKLTSRF